MGFTFDLGGSLPETAKALSHPRQRCLGEPGRSAERDKETERFPVLGLEDSVRGQFGFRPSPGGFRAFHKFFLQALDPVGEAGFLSSDAGSRA